MSQSAPSSELQILRGKLNALSAVIRLGHEAYDKEELADWAGHVVNNSVLLLPYYRSALIDLRGNAPRLTAVTGQTAVNANTEYAHHVLALIRKFRRLEKVTELTEEVLDENGASAEAEEAFAALQATSPLLYLVPFRQAGRKNADEADFLWLVEFDKPECRAVAPALLALLKEHYSESLFYVTSRKKKSWHHRLLERRSWMRPSRLILVLLLLFALSTVLVRIRQTLSAEFELIPARESIAYSPFEGVIDRCLFKSGDPVRQGDPVILFETDERQFNLETARNEYNRINAQLDLTRRQSFLDPAKRAQIKLLELQKEKAAIDIERNEWYLARSRVTAEVDGILDAGDADKLSGKAVRPGEKLFEVLGTGDMVAEIALDERNASVLNEETAITLYLHARPEVAIPARIQNVTGRPLLTPRRTYCYLIRADFSAPANLELICGMRGIARIAGPRVTLGYYLFRHLVLWYRQL